MKDIKMREQGIILKHHANISLIRGDIIDYTIIQIQMTAICMNKSGNNSQRGCFAAAAWA